MKLLVLKESEKNENRVSLTPDLVVKYKKIGIEVFVEKSAGLGSYFSDSEYKNSGAEIVDEIDKILPEIDLIISVTRTDFNYKNVKSDAIFIALLNPYFNKEKVLELSSNNIAVFALDLIPRITRAQAMDVLSSQSNLAGYRSVIEAVHASGKCVPMMMTAAGTISPAKFLIIGAGVAGLQAIATAKRLGGIISVFDVRNSAKEQVQSLGAKFIEVESEEKMDGTYAKETSEEYKQKQHELLKEIIKNQDVVISTALIPNKKAPILIDREMVKSMKSGSIIVDLASSNGGNCELTEIGKIVEINNVKIIGYKNLLSFVASEASKLFARNILNFIELLVSKNIKSDSIDLDDEIIKSTLVAHKMIITNENLKN